MLDEIKSENQELRAIQKERQISYGHSQETGPATHRGLPRGSDILDVSEFDLDKSSYDTDQLIDINKLISLRNEYPDIFIEKVMKNYFILERKLKVAYKEIKKCKKEARFYKQENMILNQKIHTLSQNYEKSEIKRK